MSDKKEIEEPHWLWEMANVHKKESNLPVTVWIFHLFRTYLKGSISIHAPA